MFRHSNIDSNLYFCPRPDKFQGQACPERMGQRGGGREWNEKGNIKETWYPVSVIGEGDLSEREGDSDGFFSTTKRREALI